jgi:hypothetical protein
VEAAETLVTLVGILGLHDKRTRGHSERVRAFVDLITDEMGLPDEDRAKIRWAALVHDLGKLTVPAGVLNKPGGLDDDEWETVRRHPDEGVRLVAGLQPWLGEWGRAIGEHHERWDGLGYPNGLAGEQICVGARIVAVADAFEVMTAARTYKKAVSRSVALREMARMSGSQFDPVAVRALLNISAPRLRWAVGPWAWLAQLPIIGTAPSLAGTVGAVAGQTAAGVGAVTLGGAVGLTALPTTTPLDNLPAWVFDVGPTQATGPTGSPTRPPPSPTASPSASATRSPQPGPTPVSVNAPVAARPGPNTTPVAVRPGRSSPIALAPVAATVSPSPSATPTPSPTRKGTRATATATPSPSASPSPSTSLSPSPSGKGKHQGRQ